MYPVSQDFASASAERSQRGDDLSFEHLLCEDSPVARTHLYLRVLYSPKLAQAIRSKLSSGVALPIRTRNVFAKILWSDLETEQQARHRNLFAQLLRRSETLMAVFGEQRLRQMLSSFIETPEFWNGKGRTLLENFALALRPTFPAGFEADALLLTGMVSGVHSDSDLVSPWIILTPEGGGPLEVEGYEYAESFLANSCLIDENGHLPKASNLNVVSTPGHRRIYVVRLPAGGVGVFAVPL